MINKNNNLLKNKFNQDIVHLVKIINIGFQNKKIIQIIVHITLSKKVLNKKKLKK